MSFTVGGQTCCIVVDKVYNGPYTHRLMLQAQRRYIEKLESGGQIKITENQESLHTDVDVGKHCASTKQKFAGHL